MRKITKFLLVSLLVCSKVYAQDLIVLNNDALDEYQVKVLEVTKDAVKYKKWSYQDGPTFILATNSILYVKYQNGEKQTFTQIKGKDKKQKEYTKVKVVKEEPTTTSTVPAVEKVADNNTQSTPIAQSTPKLNTPAETKSETPHETSSWIETKKGTMMERGNTYYPIIEGDHKSGFCLGLDLIGGYNVADNLFISAGLGYCMYGLYYGSGSYETQVDQTSLSIPIQIGYNIPLGNICSLDVATGPRLNYAIAGKYTQGQVETKYKDIDGLKRFTAEYTIGATFLIKGCGITAEYGLGLGDNGGDVFRIGLTFRN